VTAPVTDCGDVIAEALRLLAEQRAITGRARRMLDRVPPADVWAEHLDEVDG